MVWCLGWCLAWYWWVLIGLTIVVVVCLIAGWGNLIAELITAIVEAFLD